MTNAYTRRILGADTIDLQDMEVGELRKQLDRVKIWVRALLQEQRTTLDAMPATECRVFKALQTFILDVM